MTRPFRTTLATATAVAALMASVPAHADTLQIVMQSRVSVLDATLSTSHQTRNHGYMIHDTLLAIDADGELRPQMAEWEVSEDGTAFTFTLREGLTFHDGAPVTAEDAIASIKRWAQSDRMGRALMPRVTDMRAEDDRTFVIELDFATDLILSAFAKQSGLPLFVLPARLADTEAGTAITEQVGAGPFRFNAELFEPGVRVVYDRFEDYIPRDEPASGLAGGKVVNFDRVERIEMADELTMVNSLLAGEIDYLETIPFDLVPMVEGNPDLIIEIHDTTGFQSLYRFNQLNAPFDNATIRRAAMYALGQEPALQAQIGNPDFFQTCAAVFGCGMPYEFDTHAEMVIEPNPERAAELLEEAGYDGAPVVILQATDIPMIQSIPVVMAQQLRAAGFTVEVQAMDFMTLLSRRSNRGPVDDGGWSIFLTTWHNVEVEDPIRSFTVTANGPDAWAGWPDVPELVELVDTYLVTGDADERHDLARQIHDMTLEQGVSVPFGQVVRPTGRRAGIDGILEAPVPVFWNITRD